MLMLALSCGAGTALMIRGNGTPQKTFGAVVASVSAAGAILLFLHIRA